MFKKRNRKVTNIWKIGLLLLVSGIWLGVHPAEAGKILLKPGSYSFSEDPVTWSGHNDPEGKALVDGNPRTSAEAVVATFRNSIDVQIDLGMQTKVDKIALHAHAGGNYRPREVTFYVGEDWNSYEKVGTVANKMPPSTEETKVAVIVKDGIGKEGRYVKMHIEKSGNYLQLCELEVYGTALGQPPASREEPREKIEIFTSDFEKDSDNDGIPDGWRKKRWEGNPEFGWENEGYTGKKSVYIITAAGNDFGAWTSPWIDVKPGSEYELEFWYKCKTGSGQPELSVDGTEGKGDYLKANTSWTKFTRKGRVKFSDNKVKINLVLYHRPGQKVWFDAVKLYLK